MSKKDRETLSRLRVSLTDPEAALGWDKVGTYRPLYNVLLGAGDRQSVDVDLERACPQQRSMMGCSNP